MSDTSLLVSLASNGALALVVLARGWKRKVDVDADVVQGLLSQVSRLQGQLDSQSQRLASQDGRIHQLEAEKDDLERAKIEAETMAQQLRESEARTRALYTELQDLYNAISGTHQGISVRPPKDV
jgi:uncharacterized protein (DUF3084 family)